MKLSKLLESTPKWDHKDAKIRLKALQSPAITAEMVYKLALTDPDQDVRSAAIGLTTDLQLLLEINLKEITDTTGNNTIKTTAAARWVALMGSDLANFDKITDQLPLDLLVLLAGDAEHLDIRCKAAELVNDDLALEKLLLSNNHSKLYQLCATKLEDEILLTRVHKAFLDKDKNVVRIIKGKLQDIKHQREKEVAFKTAWQQTLVAIEDLSKNTHADGFSRRISVLNETWQKLNAEQALSRESNTRFKQAFDNCQNHISNLEQQKADKNLAISNALAQVNELTTKLVTSLDAINSINQVLNNTKAIWPADEDIAPLDALCHPLNLLAQQNTLWSEFQKQKHNLNPQQQLSQLKEIRWPDNFLVPAEIEPLMTTLKDQIKLQKNSEKTYQTNLGELENQLSKLTASIEEGHLKKATKLLSNLKQAAKLLSSGDLITSGDSTANKPAPQGLINRISLAEKKLIELKDWQGFATNPKREELCQKMTRLAEDTEIKPQNKASKIKQLQDEWKKLGASDSKQGQQLWSQFKKQGDIAFEPCAVFFKQQNQLREQNLAQKKKICLSLEQYVAVNDWLDTDWKAAAEILRTAQKEWRQYKDIPRASHKSIQAQFHSATRALQAKLHGEQDKNHNLKSTLIQTVSDLHSSDLSIAQIIDQTKRCQQDWKKIGITQHKVDQKLWKKFRAECDKVFARREEIKTAEQQKSNSHIQEARTLFKQFSDGLDSEAPLHSADVNRFKKTFAALALHTTSAKGQLAPVTRDFNKLVKAGLSIVAQQAAATDKQLMLELKRLGDLCTAFESGKLTSTALDSDWPGEITLKKNILKKIQQRREGKAQSKADEAERLCIQLEILADIESPAESKTARLSYQVERLTRELSQGQKETRSKHEQAQELQIDWYCLPYSDLKDKVETRFNLAASLLGLI